MRPAGMPLVILEGLTIPAALRMRLELEPRNDFVGCERFVHTSKYLVMAGPVPAIHDFQTSTPARTWMPGTRPGMTRRRDVTRPV
jgi:hypothetical protein